MVVVVQPTRAGRQKITEHEPDGWNATAAAPVRINPSDEPARGGQLVKSLCPICRSMRRLSERSANGSMTCWTRFSGHWHTGQALSHVRAWRAKIRHLFCDATTA